MGTEGMNKANSRDTDFIHSKPHTFIGERESPTCKINRHQKFLLFVCLLNLSRNIIEANKPIITIQNRPKNESCWVSQYN